MKRLRVVSVGLGPIGLAAARLALSKRNVELVGAVDVDPAKTGKDLGELLDSPDTGVVIEAEARAAYERLKPDAILHCTSSFLPRVIDQLVEAAEAGVNVVSSTEELLVPDWRHPELAARLHQAALGGGATVVGTGVNPGYAMDFVAAVGSAVCFDVQSVHCLRVVDAGSRRLPLQQKVGAGLTIDEFKAREAAGGFGHIGIEESVVLLARALGFELDSVEYALEPVLSKTTRQTPFLTVEAGRVAGIRNFGYGRINGSTVIELDLTMAVGADNPRDEVRLAGTPDLHLSFPGGIPGDLATAAILVNTLSQAVEAEPGLKTVLELAPPRLVR
ncbi:MAG: dihydrodipicolinate reductase [Vulcanimicrobiota bacterium]